MKRYERLGWTESERSSFRYVVEGIESGQRKFGVKDTSIVPADIGASQVDDCFCATVLQHLEADHPFASIKQFVADGVQIALDYFWGDWRDSLYYCGETIGREECRRKLQWIDTYSEGLLLSLLLNGGDATEKLTGWPGADLADKDEVGYKPEDAYYHVLLAHIIRGIEPAEYSTLVDRIRNSRRRRAKLLLKAALDMAAGEEQEFFNSLKSYLQYFLKSEFDPTVFVRLVSIEGSILWNYAKLRGRVIESFGQSLQDLIVTPESIGL